MIVLAESGWAMPAGLGTVVLVASLVITAAWAWYLFR
jgi:hypothetical protein